MAVYEIPVIDAPWQRLETYLSDNTVTIELHWNAFSGRWAMTLTLLGVTRIRGRRLVPNTDLLAGYGLGIGRLFLVDWAGQGGEPGRTELPSGAFRLIHDEAAA